MDKISLYEQAICEILEQYAQKKRHLSPKVKSHLIIDREHKHYQLLSVGWVQDKYIYTTAFHFSLEDDKIWIHQNNTEVLIVDELCEKGVVKSDIILGFISEYARSYTGFAVA